MNPAQWMLVFAIIFLASLAAIILATRHVLKGRHILKGKPFNAEYELFIVCMALLAICCISVGGLIGSFIWFFLDTYAKG